jgi:hypothetical protein
MTDTIEPMAKTKRVQDPDQQLATELVERARVEGGT